MVEETRAQQEIYSIFRSLIYIFLVLELIIFLPFPISSSWFHWFLNKILKLTVFQYLWYTKGIEVLCILITCIGTKAKKELEFSIKRQVVYPMLFGVVFVYLSVFLHQYSIFPIICGITTNRWLYAITSIIGIMCIHYAGDAISRYYNNRVLSDRWNFENESFEQSRIRIDSPYSVNIPMIFYWKSKMHKGWINIINPFRGTIVLGTPGSGKSFGIIDPFIRQHAAKGFAMMVYDYKFPTLAKNLYYQYRKNKKLNRLPNNCQFYVINFSDVEYSHRINPIQKKYIPDLTAAAETAATLLQSLNKGGEKKGGSEQFFQNSAENFLAAIIYFFINYHPVGYKNGEKLQHYISYNGKKLRYKLIGWDGAVAEDENGEIVLDFLDENAQSVIKDINGLYVDLNGFIYRNIHKKQIIIERSWYENADGKIVFPDTIAGEFSDMPHILAFLQRSYNEIFDILMQDKKIASLMAPFASAYKNQAMDQLEGMVGTLRVNAARLVSPEAYWVFSGDDFDLKISDPRHPSYLVIANDPEKEQTIGALNALILNRLVTRINSQGNIPVSIIVDELPTLYFHKIDRLIGTARSNKVAVTLGFQELPQLEADYGKVGMQKIITTCGNIFMGAARNKETLEWAQNDIFGKTKQTSRSISINDSKVSTSVSEKMDYLVPASKIADMATGWLAGQSARDFTPTETSHFRHIDLENSAEFATSKYFCKTNFDMNSLKNEEKNYKDIPKLCIFADESQKEILLNRNFQRINDDITTIVKELIGIDNSNA